ncbi:copper chaperone PCu(A)C [Frankia sp. Cppng1_Ct_nod]|uniref:copper chaperone PCu(A)C n=1 Tax=Frankia sp. Cppng1_Ct_nod TaxID=2897162 RepID=UPI001041616D|nr:copper chaperone PCu(A)C [Frankia sp. Cppng1_Ct_nod]
MSHRPDARTATVSLFAAASLIGTVALSSCAAGTDAVTSQTRTTTNTVSGAIGTISLRNLYVAGPATSGGKAQVISAFFNGGTQDDQIIQVASPVASGGQAPVKAVLRPGGSNIYIADGNAPTLTGLNRDLLVGQAVPVTFTFAKAGSITLSIPVEPPAPGASASPQPTAATLPTRAVGTTASTATTTAGSPTSTPGSAAGTTPTP